jgi:hypothetical protein
MKIDLISLYIAGLAFAFSIAAITLRLMSFRKLNRPYDQAPPKGRTNLGVAYAYTLGMAPWAKESTRRHWLSYMRGVAFHLGIILGLAVFLASPWMDRVPLILRQILGIGAGFGAFFGTAGLIARLVESNLKSLSTVDDYVSVLLVSLFLASASLWLLYSPGLPIFYLTSAAMLVYAPFSKIRHCIYFVYSRLFYGKMIGSRAILPHNQQEVERV